MKEIDLERNLETLIIDGLIRESEMEGVEFATAMRHISDEAFYAIIRSQVEVDAAEEIEPDMPDVLAKECEIKYDCYLPPAPCEMAICFDRAFIPEESRFDKSPDSDEDDFRSQGMKLVVEHIRNRRKYAAINELKRLIERTKGSPFGDSCEDLLAKLEK